MSTYFGLSITDSLFPLECDVIRRPLTLSEVIARQESLIPLDSIPLVMHHLLRTKLNLQITHPSIMPSLVYLTPGDSIIIMNTSPLFSSQNCEESDFIFGEWTVLSITFTKTKKL